MKVAIRTPLAAALTVIAACSSPPEGVRTTDPTGGLVVNPGVDTVLIADTVRFAVLDSLPATSGPVSWTVSDSRVAAIEQQAGASALVRALSQGTATVTAAQGGHSASGLLVVEGPGTPTKLAFTVQPSNATAGVALTPAVAVTIENVAGAPVTSATSPVTLTVVTSLGGLAGSMTVQPVNAVATFENLSIQKAGSGYTLTASSSSLARATSVPFAITPAAPAELAFVVQPDSAPYPLYAQLIMPVVQVGVLDAFANSVPSATNTITIAIGTNLGGAALSGTTTVTAVKGIATFANLAIDQPGTAYTLTATASGLTGDATGTFNIGALPTFAAVSAGRDHTCGLTPAGVAYCWGANSAGELGNPIAGTCIVALRRAVYRYSCSLTPLPVSGGLTFTVVSSGNSQTCGVSAGAAYCWGGGYATTPVAVPGGPTFATLSVGSDQICGLTPAGAAYCWGFNGNGNLGNGTTTSSATPVAVSGGLTFATLSSGGYHTCGLTATGAAYCWGYNNYGELGNGTTTGATTPVAVAGGLTFAVVSGGENHTCGVTTAGTAYCWGDNFEGELGTGTTTNSTTPVAVSGGLTFAAISAGWTHTCGVTAAGSAYCWGEGELGNGTTTSSSTPVAVSGGIGFTVISAGNAHSCGVTAAGSAYCWGNNSSGQLGNGTRSDSAVPERS